MKKKIGITGGIGVGKSTVSARLLQLGAAVLNADTASREIVRPGTKGLKAVAAHFSEDILLAGGELDRGRLASLIFHSPDAREALNSILHPLILERLKEQEHTYFLENPDGTLFFEIPLLIEIGMHKEMDEVWLITSSEEARIKRIMARDRCDRAHAMLRIKSQMPDEEKKPFATHILDNSGDVAALLIKVDALYKGLGERS